jgi:hypothetical protein
LDELYETGTRSIVTPNHMVKMFALTADEITASTAPQGWAMLTQLDFTPVHLARAKDRLSRVDVFGLQDRFEEFCDELESRFEWKLGSPHRANRSVRDELVSDELRARIAADNAFDVEFFAFARDLYEARFPHRRAGS